MALRCDGRARSFGGPQPRWLAKIGGRVWRAHWKRCYCLYRRNLSNYPEKKMAATRASCSAEQILAKIVEDYRCALKAEGDFIEWERAHRQNGPCDEFAARFCAWLDASEPFVAGQSVIEEQFPELVGELSERLKAVK